MSQDSAFQSFGSPSSRDRPIPNVVFVIDTGSSTLTTSEAGGTAQSPPDFETFIRITVLRILLYFHIHVDPRFRWSYQLFDLGSVSTFHKAVTKHAREFIPVTLAEFAADLNGQLENQSGIEKEDGEERSPWESSPSFVEKVSTTLRKTLTDFRWDWGGSGSSMVLPSPVRPRKQMTDGAAPVRLRNYMYFISALPSTVADLRTYVGLGGAECGVSRCLEVMQQHLLGGGLWSAFLEKRAALSWITTPSLPSVQIEDNKNFEIQSTLSCVLAALGGVLAPGALMTDAIYGVPLPTLMKVLRQKALYPAYGKELVMGKPAGTTRRCLPLSQKKSAFKTQWEGMLIDGYAETEQPHVPIVITHVAGGDEPSTGERKLLGRGPSLSLPSTANIKALPFAGAKMEIVHRFHAQLLDAEWMEKETYQCVSPLLDTAGTISFWDVQYTKKEVLMVQVHLEPNSMEDTSAAESKGMALNDRTTPSSSPSEKVDLEPIERCAVIIPIMPGFAVLRLIKPDSEDDCIGQCDLPEDCLSYGATVDDTLLSQWYSNELDQQIHSMIFNGESARDSVKQLCTATFDIWYPEMEDERLRTRLELDARPPPIPPPSPKFSSPLPAPRSCRKSKTAGRPLGDCVSVDDIVLALKKGYMDVLLGHNSLAQFMDTSLSNVHEAIASIVFTTVGPASPSRSKYNRANRAAMNTFLEFVSRSTIRGVTALEQRFRSISELLSRTANEASEPDDPARVQIPHVDPDEARMLTKWWAGVSNTASLDPTVDLARLLRRKLTLMKTEEAKLQLVLLFDMLRIHVQDKVELPDISHWFASPQPPPAEPSTTTDPSLSKRKRKSMTSALDSYIVRLPKRRKSDMPKQRPTAVPEAESETADNHPKENDSPEETKAVEATPIVDRKAMFVKAIEELMDRICIWNAVTSFDSGPDESTLLKTFVEPVLIKYYNSFFPDIVKSLFIKAGGDPSTQNPVPPSPFFKKKRKGSSRIETKVGSGMSGVKRSGNRSSKANERRRGVLVSNDANAKPSTTSRAAAMPAFLRGLGKRQISLAGMPKSNSNGSSRDAGKKESATLAQGQSAFMKELRRSSTASSTASNSGPTGSSQPLGRRSTTYSLTTKNATNPGLSRTATSICAGPISKSGRSGKGSGMDPLGQAQRTKSMPAFSEHADNPFWDAPSSPTSSIASVKIGTGKTRGSVPSATFTQPPRRSSSAWSSVSSGSMEALGSKTDVNPAAGRTGSLPRPFAEFAKPKLNKAFNAAQEPDEEVFGRKAKENTHIENPFNTSIGSPSRAKATAIPHSPQGPFRSPLAKRLSSFATLKRDSFGSTQYTASPAAIDAELNPFLVAGNDNVGPRPKRSLGAASGSPTPRKRTAPLSGGNVTPEPKKSARRMSRLHGELPPRPPVFSTPTGSRKRPVDAGDGVLPPRPPVFGTPAGTKKRSLDGDDLSPSVPTTGLFKDAQGRPAYQTVTPTKARSGSRLTVSQMKLRREYQAGTPPPRRASGGGTKSACTPNAPSDPTTPTAKRTSDVHRSPSVKRGSQGNAGSLHVPSTTPQAHAMQRSPSRLHPSVTPSTIRNHNNAIRNTPLATPGSCQRLQSMLMEFADDDEDGFGWD
ncbi:uncharacterized protein EV422DRAFT_523486 [Fimicolochytrium jonesii]|uniref:uncharacterized protein n=1 Tax=Fimicolochytrium jonesii TaxID=1396493 RepID=UPI0022FDBC9A|nr:uncharacterized protein EV422DRAFT_523486 [Fimicolochytrium jonesii]KAI8823126.1 hypothetical protein EV422DRAFT_523486 [Fimicolochytrium jonesii]